MKPEPSKEARQLVWSIRSMSNDSKAAMLLDTFALKARLDEVKAWYTHMNNNERDAKWRLARIADLEHQIAERQP